MRFVKIQIQGIVQGVGFRPFVWQLAQQFHLKGWVLNHAQGVDIVLRLSQANSDTLLTKLQQALQTQAPPLAQIEQIHLTELSPEVVQQHYPQLNHCDDFQILASDDQATMHTTVPPDAATCPACLAEINDPNNRRYGYPFTNCTHCGSRFSIIHAMPYDRHQTSMATFPLCSVCQQEYQDPSNRRFHAQPNACPQCGPQIALLTPTEKNEKNSENWQKCQNSQSRWAEIACDMLLAGKILAIKGIGGYHLVCDAANDTACQTLRNRKHRPSKPFALMAPNLATLKTFAECPPVAEACLTSSAAPIVLLPRKPQTPPLSNQIAPHQPRLGIMLPSNPLHHLLMQQWHKIKPEGLLVFTSANLSGQPQIYQDESLADFTPLADAILTHNRPILRRLEDSVVTLNVPQTRILPLRLARGYAPQQLPLPKGFPARKALAAGGDLKNSLAFQKGQQITLMHYLGDLENYEVQTAYQQTLDDLQQLYDFQPDHLITDLHPGYYSTQSLTPRFPQLTLHSVQHHHAHLNAVLLEHQIPYDHPPVMGIILDGLGYGTDDTLWGGELLYGGYASVQRLAHLTPFPLLGGNQASKAPWRNAYALLKPLGKIEDLIAQYPHVATLKHLQNKPLALLDSMQAANLNCPLTSSTGRLFDAVAALCNLHFDQITYEGEAAIALENLLTPALLESQLAHGYPMPYQAGQIQTIPMIQAILNDLNTQTDPAILSARFHIGLVKGLLNAALNLHSTHPFTHLVLGGGVCQNQSLIWLFEHLTPPNLTLLSPQTLPANDQALAIGQLASVQTSSQTT